MSARPQHQALAAAVLGVPRGTVVTVVAPGGYGKSTLVDAIAVATMVARMDLRTQHNDPGRFARDLMTAVGAADAALDVARPDSDAFADTVLDHIAKTGIRCLLFDDVHLIDEPAVQAALSSIGWKAVDVTVVFSSRRSPPIGVSALKVKRRLREIDERDLALSVDDARELVSDLGADPDRLGDDIVRLGGWPAGVVLLGLANARGDGPRARVELETDVQALLRDDILAQLEPDLRTFSYELGVMGVFNGDAAAAVTGRDAARTMMQQLIDRRLFIVSLGQQEWFRFHDIVGEGLARLGAEVLGKARADELQVRLIEELLEREEFDLVNDKMLSVEDPRLLRSMLTRSAQAHQSMLIARYEIANLDRIYRRLSIADFGDDVANLIFATTAATILADGERTTQLYDHMVQHLPAEVLNLQPMVLIHGFERMLAGDIDAASERFVLATRMVESSPVPDPNMRYLTLQGVPPCEILHDRLDHADQVARTAIDLGRTIDARLAMCWLHAGRGLVALWSGDLDGAADLLDRAEHAADISLNPSERVFLAALQTGVRAASGDHEGARGVAVAAMSHRAFPPLHVGTTLPLLALAESELALGMRDEARARVAAAESILSRATGAKLPERLLSLPRFASLRASSSAQPIQPNHLDLSASERRILPMLQSRMTLREIAAELYLSVNTVKTHTQSIYRKLGVGSRNEAVALFGNRRAG